MCLPALPAAVKTALTIAGAVGSAAGVYGTMAQADAQADAQAELLSSQRQAQQEEIEAKRDQAIGERIRAARREAARRLVAAGESGVGGVSLRQSIMNTFGRANQDAAVANRQSAFDDRASQTNYASGMNRIQRPSWIDAGLQIVAGYNSGRELGESVSKSFDEARSKLTVGRGRK